ncbi:MULTISPECIES: hypothetical protein [Cryobacterium]|nr:MULTISPECIES: hypothetical protein [Cryobacterium]
MGVDQYQIYAAYSSSPAWEISHWSGFTVKSQALSLPPSPEHPSRP